MDAVSRVVVLTNNLPHASDRTAVEAAVKRALTGRPGEWRVILMEPHNASYWQVSITGPLGPVMNRRFDGPTEQDPEFIQQAVQSIFQSAKDAESLGVSQKRYNAKVPTKKRRPFVIVLMPFSSDFDDIYQLGIKPACKAAGADVERVDEQIFSESILTRIYEQIARADIVVAEMTGNNPNVFYEVGYAHALHKTIVLLTSKAADIPFDLKHYTHIVYGDRIADLQKNLKTRIRHLLRHDETATHAPSVTSLPPEGVYWGGGDPNYQLTLRHLPGRLLEISNPTWRGVGIMSGNEYYGTYLYGANAYASDVRNTWGVHHAIYDPTKEEFSVQLYQLGRGILAPELGRWVRAKR